MPATFKGFNISKLALFLQKQFLAFCSVIFVLSLTGLTLDLYAYLNDGFTY